MSTSWKDLRDNWPIVAALACGLIAWGETRVAVATDQNDIKDAKVQIEAIKSQITDIRIASEGVRAASEAQQKATERQLDALLAQLQQLNARPPR